MLERREYIYHFRPLLRPRSVMPYKEFHFINKIGPPASQLIRSPTADVTIAPPAQLIAVIHLPHIFHQPIIEPLIAAASISGMHTATTAHVLKSPPFGCQLSLSQGILRPQSSAAAYRAPDYRAWYSMPLKSSIAAVPSTADASAPLAPSITGWRCTFRHRRECLILKRVGFDD